MNVNRSNKRKRFHTKKKARSRCYPEDTLTDLNYTDDKALLVNTPAQAESLLHSLEQAAGGIGIYMISNKTEDICFKQGAISMLSLKLLKLVDQSTYLGSKISSTESNVNIRLVKVWYAIERLLIRWKSDLSGKIKQDFFQAMAMSILLYRCIK